MDMTLRISKPELGDDLIRKLPLPELWFAIGRFAVRRMEFSWEKADQQSIHE
jgi:hypothetical protein